jgi:hypothetical protein
MVDQFLSTLVRGAVRRLGPSSLRPVSPGAADHRFILCGEGVVAGTPWATSAERVSFEPGEKVLLRLSSTQEATPLLCVRVRDPGGVHRTLRYWLDPHQSDRVIDLEVELRAAGACAIEVAYAGTLLGSRRFHVLPAPR